MKLFTGKRSLFLFLFLCGIICRAYSQPIIDLSHHDFENGGYSLAGNWGFHWNELLGPSEILPAPGELIRVPQSWARLGHPRLGVATYHLKILLPESQTGLAIFFPIINSSAKIWVNGELVKETGKVSANRDLYRAKLLTTYVPLPEKISSAEIIVQVANFTYYHSGIAGNPQIDKASSIFEKQNRTNGIENFFAEA